MYWHSRYWPERYWALSYWQQASYSGALASTLDNVTANFQASGNTGSYWPTQYWGVQYWYPYYWKTGTPSASTGSIGVTLENASALFAGASTWTEYIDLSVNVSLAWQITAYDAYTGTIAVTLANATSTAVGAVLPPDSSSGVVSARTADATAAFAGIHVAPAGAVGIVSASLADTTAAITGSFSAHSVANGSITSTLADFASAFTGASTIPERTGSIAITLDNLQSAIAGFSIEGYANVGDFRLTLQDVTSDFLGEVVNPIVVPVESGTPIENPNAIPIPSNYEICDRTGFKVIAGTLIKQWDGTMVRPRSWESRHPQDFVRGRAEKPRASPRPEQPDVFIEDDEPVTAEDL